MLSRPDFRRFKRAIVDPALTRVLFYMLCVSFMKHRLNRVFIQFLRNCFSDTLLMSTEDNILFSKKNSLAALFAPIGHSHASEKILALSNPVANRSNQINSRNLTNCQAKLSFINEWRNAK